MAFEVDVLGDRGARARRKPWRWNDPVDIVPWMHRSAFGCAFTVAERIGLEFRAKGCVILRVPRRW